ncbi:sulfatase [Ruania alkalisoli]|uniref:Sulfatase n=1 Tax=Ruania alkalisoli TaxID=2779775 RepID=A0A7M1SVL1_9MICO|nr:sulfatase [Ruania alkalisoli]QOR71117.1 sulfatase [Ruania alkalisoli]
MTSSISRRMLLSGAAAATATAVAGSSSSASSHPSGRRGRSVDDERPNVVFIVTDDQRYSAPLDMMPKAERWFSDHTTSFSNAYITTPLCCPARASLFTGQYAHNNGVYRLDDSGRMDQNSTLQRTLKDEGYTTAIFGKYFSRWDIASNPPYFDEWAITSNGHTGVTANVQGDLVEIDQYQTDFVASSAVRFIHQQKSSDDPFLLYLEPFGPHGPFEPPARYRNTNVPEFEGNLATEEEDLSDKPYWVQGRAENIDQEKISEWIPRQQRRMLMAVDDMVEKVAHALETSGLAENTVVFFLSDNGFMWGEHGVTRKSYPYTPSVQIPFYMRWPAGGMGGQVDDRLVAANIDATATVMDILGLSDHTELDGRSLLSSGERERLLLEYYGLNRSRNEVKTWASTRTREFQYTEYFADDDRTELILNEYYDLVDDPWQLNNLLAETGQSDHLDVAALSEQLRNDMDCAGRACP